MNLSQIIEALPLQVYVRRGETRHSFFSPPRLQEHFPAWIAKPTLPGLTGKQTVADAAEVAVRF